MKNIGEKEQQNSGRILVLHSEEENTIQKFINEVIDPVFDCRVLMFEFNDDL